MKRVRDPLPCATQLETILGLARKGLNNTDVSIYTAFQKEHVKGAFARLEQHLRKRGLMIESTIFPEVCSKGWKDRDWRLPHGKRTDDKAGVAK